LTQSLTKFRQEVGRGDRLHWSKENTIIADHASCWSVHGSPGRPHEWSLDGRRKKTAEEVEAYAVHRCPKCYAVIERTTRTCRCGHAFADLVKARVITVGDGQLKRIEETAEDFAAKERRIAQGRARTKEALMAMGMSEGRAEHVLVARDEKDALRRELAACRRANGLPVKGIDDLKPKALRAEIALLSGRMVA
jgi:hypothetical protein